jgi:anhydro-N-acetylmuramic acid kinase
LTASSIINALTSWGNDPTALVICGGGRHNIDLLNRLKRGSLKLKNRLEVVEPSEHWGVDGDAIEAAAFAWLAHRRLENLPGNVAAVTGSRGERILGAIY